MNDKTIGMLFSFTHALIWSLLPVLAIHSYKSVDSGFTLAAVTTIASLFFALVLTWRHAWTELTIRKAYPFILGNTFLNAFLFFGLVFWATSMTTAGNVAIMLLMENFLAIVILGGVGYDQISRKDVLGGLLMISGALIVLFPGKLQLNIGDVIILFATMLPVLGNVCSKKARQYVGSDTIMFIRTVLSAPLFWALVLWRGTLPAQSLSWSTILALFVNGFFVMGLARMLWIEAINRIPISTANSISSVYPFFTLIAAYLILGDKPTIWQIGALVPIIMGLNLLIRRDK